MSIFILTAVILIIFFPIIYFMWSAFISMLMFRIKMKDMENT